MSGRVTTAGGGFFPRVTPFGGAEYNAAVAPLGHARTPSRAGVRAGMGWTDGSRRPLGPLGGPACTRQTGYRNVLYWDSWTAAQPPRFAPPPVTATGELPADRP